MAATVIDSLIVELGLDPSNFDEGQRRAEGKLRDLERNAARSVRGVGRQVDDTGRQFIAIVEAIGHPVAAIEGALRHIVLSATPTRQTVRELGEQGHRTGAQVEAGALAGAAGFRVMAGAVLLAGAAVGALGAGIKAVGDEAQRVWGVRVGAAAAGMPVQEFSAVSQALRVAGNVPQSETQGWMAQLRQFQENFSLGYVDRGRLQAFSRLGLAEVATRASPEEIMRQLALRFSREPADRAIAEGGLIGMSPSMVMGLRRLGPGFGQAVATQRPTAITDQQAKAYDEFLRKLNDLKNAFDAFGRMLGSAIIPALGAVAARLDQITRDLEGSTHAAAALRAFFQGIADLIGGHFKKLQDDIDTLDKAVPPLSLSFDLLKANIDLWRALIDLVRGDWKGLHEASASLRHDVANIGSDLKSGAKSIVDFIKTRIEGLLHEIAPSIFPAPVTPGTAHAVPGGGYYAPLPPVPQKSMAAQSGPVARTIVSTLKGAGASEAVIAGFLSAALGEGGVTQPWKQNAQGAPAFGPWQLHDPGELPRYRRAGGQPGDVAAQALYVYRRLREIDPNIDTASSAQVAADFAKFESSGKDASYYGAHLAAARQLLKKIEEIAAKNKAETPSTITSPAPSSSLSRRADHADIPVKTVHAPAPATSGAVTSRISVPDASHLAAVRQIAAHVRAIRQSRVHNTANTTHKTIHQGDTNTTVTVNAPGGNPQAIGMAVGGAVGSAVKRNSLVTLANAGLN